MRWRKVRRAVYRVPCSYVDGVNHMELVQCLLYFNLYSVVYRDNENERERRVPSRHFFGGPAYRDLFTIFCRI